MVCGGYPRHLQLRSRRAHSNPFISFWSVVCLGLSDYTYLTCIILLLVLLSISYLFNVHSLKGSNCVLYYYCDARDV